MHHDKILKIVQTHKIICAECNSDRIILDVAINPNDPRNFSTIGNEWCCNCKKFVQFKKGEKL